jgi:hypothetical protein
MAVYNFSTKSYDKECKLEAGKVYKVSTNSELLNEVFNTHYKGYAKNTWRYSPNAFAWMVRIDGKKRSNGVTYSWLDKEIILQQCDTDKKGDEGDSPALDEPDDYRLVFEIADINSAVINRKYVFKGVFLLDRKVSTPQYMVFKKVYDVFSYSPLK